MVLPSVAERALALVCFPRIKCKTPVLIRRVPETEREHHVQGPTEPVPPIFSFTRRG